MEHCSIKIYRLYRVRTDRVFRSPHNARPVETYGRNVADVLMADAWNYLIISLIDINMRALKGWASSLWLLASLWTSESWSCTSITAM